MNMIDSAVSDIQSELPSHVRLYACGQTSDRADRAGRVENLQSLLSAQTARPVSDTVTRSLQFSGRVNVLQKIGTFSTVNSIIIFTN